MLKFSICISTPNNPEQLANFYCNIFQNCKIDNKLSHADIGLEDNITSSQSSSLFAIKLTIEGLSFEVFKGGQNPPNSTTSLFVSCKSMKEAKRLWVALGQHAKILMPISKYSWSNCYGWLTDQFGISWQIMVDSTLEKSVEIIPALFFVNTHFGKAKAAIDYYTKVFANSQKLVVEEYNQGDSHTPGFVKFAKFKLDQQPFVCMENESTFHYELINTTSIIVNCSKQNEIDSLWKDLSKEGTEKNAGCLTDKFGVEWQILPEALNDYLKPDPFKKAHLVLDTLKKMTKVDHIILEKIWSTKPTAWVLTNGIFHTKNAKTAHGLVRQSERFEIIGLIDGPTTAGMDAGMLLDGKLKGIPVFENIEAALKKPAKAQYLIIGVAVGGGKIPEPMIDIIKKAIVAGISIVCGLHEYLVDNLEIKDLALKHKVNLIDVRYPKPKSALHFWTGNIYNVKAPIVAVMGQDCALGKRTTAKLICKSLNDHDINAQMVYSGQTGWLQGGQYGFVLDSTYNDFVSGELEHAIVTCWNEKKPQIIFLEGQSGLRNPSGPCGSEFIISGNAKHVVLIVSPKRKYFDYNKKWGKIPSLNSEIKLIKLLGAKVIALVLNTSNCSQEEKTMYMTKLQKKSKLPVFMPIENGADDLAKLIASKLLS
ncbi:MAG: DUF1611 domain-containing protein [Alphaproteobacteria bacterium]|nr:DUF1611 domain-containing protein [Alphaproteobacteria bacterium]